ncbi:Flp pilus assembly protein CpaB [Kroppenstedtia eburnea]|uniref:Flp pilus assembly protein CpaB n=1 Tax=Kroppenstedtia eburnea TaxID=714067 RepID=A0A1N7MVK4_9BACL|nr:Flp pilus assembly protein CpaB [Kroppenstedtia eburnea]
MQDAKRRAIIFAVLSVLLATVAGFLFLEETAALQAGLGAPTTVYVAKQEIASREILRPEFFEAKEIPSKYVTSSMVTDPAEIDGQVSVVPLGKGDQLTKSMLKPARQLNDGESRMVLLRTSDKVLFDDSFTAQDRVDIIVSYEKDPKTGAEKPKTTVFMKDKLIVGVSKNQKSIGIELTLKEAEKLVYAENFAHSIRVLKAPQEHDMKKDNEKDAQDDPKNSQQQGQQQQNSQNNNPQNNNQAGN